APSPAASPTALAPGATCTTSTPSSCTPPCSAATTPPRLTPPSAASASDALLPSPLPIARRLQCSRCLFLPHAALPTDPPADAQGQHRQSRPLRPRTWRRDRLARPLGRRRPPPRLARRRRRPPPRGPPGAH